MRSASTTAQSPDARRCRVAASWLLALVFAAAGGCNRAGGPVAFHADGYPEKLSDWRVVFRHGSRLELNDRVVPYDLNTPLFSDYAQKLRTVWLPEGAAAARYSAADAFEFPVGTVISKTFYYGTAADGSTLLAAHVKSSAKQDGIELEHHRLIETRLLVRRESGWVALPYVWNAEQTEAYLARAGRTIRLTLQGPSGPAQTISYLVPNVNQCSGCHATNHTTRALKPIGLKARHLNREFDYANGRENQPAHWPSIGYLAGAPDPASAPRLADWTDTHATLDARARAYLDINCGHCHNAHGAADTSGLLLDASAPEDRRMGLCKPPVAAGQGTGDHEFTIVPGHPEDSILTSRMGSLDPGAMMPELGRASTHVEGVALIADWIRAWPGRCDPAPGQPL